MTARIDLSADLRSNYDASNGACRCIDGPKLVYVHGIPERILAYQSATPEQPIVPQCLHHLNRMLIAIMSGMAATTLIFTIDRLRVDEMRWPLWLDKKRIILWNAIISLIFGFIVTFLGWQQDLLFNIEYPAHVRLSIAA